MINTEAAPSKKQMHTQRRAAEESFMKGILTKALAGCREVTGNSAVQLPATVTAGCWCHSRL